MMLREFMLRYLKFLSVIGLVLCGVALWICDYTLDNPNYSIVMQGESGAATQKEVSFPYKQKDDEVYRLSKYKIEFEQGLFSRSKFLIIPDNCARKITLNGNDIDLSKMERKDRCDWKIGFKVDASEYLLAGKNTLYITVANLKRSEHYGLDVQRDYSIFISLASLMFIAAGMLGIYSAARKFGLEMWAGLILCAAVPYFAFWMYYYPNTSISPDLRAHTSYIVYISENWLNPYGFEGRQGFHPPLYYYVAAFIYKISDSINNLDPSTSLRGFSLIMYMIFCLFGVKTIQIVMKRENITYYASVMLLVLWPLSVLAASRINNDIAYYAVWAAAYYYLIRWYQEKNTDPLRIAIMLAGLALMIKTNSVILISIMGACGIYALLIGHTKFRQLFQKKMFVAYGVFILGAIVNLGKIIYTNLFYSKDVLGEHLGVQGQFIVTLSKYTSFKLWHFISYPFAGAKEPSLINLFLKTMFYGNRTFKYAEIASVMNSLLAIFLCITFFATAVALVGRKRSFSSLVPYLLAIIIPLAAIVIYCIVKNWSIGHNLRYILPMLVPLIALFALGLESIRTVTILKPIYWIGIIVGFGLPALGMALYLSQYLW